MSKTYEAPKHPCAIHNSKTAHFYCAQCKEPRCGWCVDKSGACVRCRAVVRSIEAITLAGEQLV